MKFINHTRYNDLDRIAAARTAHFAYADGLRAAGKLAIGGPLMNDDGRRVGLLFIYEARSREEALGLARDDPFALADALSSYEISEWRLRSANLALLVATNRSTDQSASKETPVRLFANVARYVADKSKLAAVRPAHWAYDQELRREGKLALAGAFADDGGGLFVYNVARREDAVSCFDQDPFAREGVIARHEVLEWRIEGVNLDLLTTDVSSEARAS